MLHADEAGPVGEIRLNTSVQTLHAPTKRFLQLLNFLDPLLGCLQPSYPPCRLWLRERVLEGVLGLQQGVGASTVRCNPVPQLTMLPKWLHRTKWMRWLPRRRR